MAETRDGSTTSRLKLASCRALFESDVRHATSIKTGAPDTLALMVLRSKPNPCTWAASAHTPTCCTTSIPRRARLAFRQAPWRRQPRSHALKIVMWNMTRSHRFARSPARAFQAAAIQAKRIACLYPTVIKQYSVHSQRNYHQKSNPNTKTYC